MPHGDAGRFAKELPAESLQELVLLCQTYDTDVLPAGPGSFRRAGLLAVAERRTVAA